MTLTYIFHSGSILEAEKFILIFKNRTRDEIIAEFDDTISILTNKPE